MRKFAEVFTSSKTNGETVWTKVDGVDVTDEPDGGQSVVDALKATHGLDASYRYHYCRHDEYASCTVEKISGAMDMSAIP